MSKPKPDVTTQVGAWYFGIGADRRVSVTVNTMVGTRAASYIEFEMSESEFESTYKQFKALRKQMKNKEDV